MQQEGTTYSADPVEHLETVVGDEMQAEALPRVKIKGWNNEVNLSVGVIHDETIDHTMTLDGDKAIWEQGDVSASFEPLISTTAPDTYISLIDEGEISPQRIAAGYEVDRYFNWGHTIHIYSSNQRAMMYYGFYNANEFLDRSKLDIPEVRLSGTNWNDPMTMDNKLVLIEVHYNKEDDTDKIHNSTITAITEVLARYGIEAYQKPLNKYKLYYKDGDKDVKFFSTGFFSGQYYAYLNLGHDYNGALAYSNDPNPVPRSDQYAYGLPDILPDTITTEIIERYAELYGLPLVPRVFTPAEEAKIAKIEAAHNNENWIVNGKRDDVWRLTASEQNEDGFEFDITLATKPDTNVYTMSIKTKDLKFGKQPAISDDKVKTEYQSPRVTGSYAVYHDSKQGNEYKSGKAFHIYRPIIKDATGWEVWGDLDIDTEMRITIPQDFIDNATYPIVIDPTFGYTTQGATAVTTSNLTVASDAILATTGNLASVIGVSGQSLDTVAGIYNGAGELMHTSLTATALQEPLFFSSFPTLPAAGYRIAYSYGTVGGYAPNGAYYDTITGTSYSLLRAYDGTLPQNMSAFTTQTTRLYSLYGMTGYQWPIMMGNASSLPLNANPRFQPMDGGSSTTWAASDTQPVVAPTAAVYSNFRFDLTTAPGGVTERLMSVSSDLPANITSAAVTASNTTQAKISVTGDALSVISTPTGTPAASTGNKWRLAVTSANQPWYSTTITAASTTANRFLGVQDGGGISTTAGPATVIMPNDSGNIVNAYCELIGGTLTAGSYTITLVKNSVDFMTMVLDASNAYRTSAGPVAVTNSDQLYWKIAPSAVPVPSAALRIAISCEYDSSVDGNGIVFGGDSVNVSGTTYSSSFDAWNATENLISSLAFAHTITALRADLTAAPISPNTRTLTFRKNAANQTPAITISTTATTGSWTGSLAVATDDLTALQHTSTGSPTASSLNWAYVFAATAFATQTYAPQMLLKGIG